MSANNIYQQVGFVLNSIQLGMNLISLTTALCISMILIYSLCFIRMKRKEKIISVSSLYLYLLMSILMILAIAINADALLEDMHKPSFISSFCTSIRYTAVTIFCTLHYIYIDQALYRLCRIVYSEYRWLRSPCLYFILPCFHLIFSMIVFIPLLLWQDFVSLRENYCSSQSSSFRSSIWILLNGYCFPVTLVVVVYARLSRFIRQQQPNQSIAVKRRQQRSLIAARRVLIIVILLGLLGLPRMILLLRRITIVEEYSLSTELTHTSAAMSTSWLSVSVLFSTHQLKTLILKHWKRNQVSTVA